MLLRHSMGIHELTESLAHNENQVLTVPRKRSTREFLPCKKSLYTPEKLQNFFNLIQQETGEYIDMDYEHDKPR